MRQPLNRIRVVEAGLELIDREGLAALNLRRLAKDLGVTPMALYNHVAGKDDLLDAMATYVVGGLEERLDHSDPWDRQVEQAMLDLHDALDRHPGVTDLIVAHAEGDRLNELRDALIAVMRSAGFGKTETEDILRALVSYVVGFVVLARSRAPVKVRRGSPRSFEYGLDMLINTMRERHDAHRSPAA